MKKMPRILIYVVVCCLLSIQACKDDDKPVEPDPTVSFGGVYKGTTTQRGPGKLAETQVIRGTIVLITPESKEKGAFLLSFLEPSTRAIVDTISGIVLSGRDPNYLYSRDTKIVLFDLGYTLNQDSLSLNYSNAGTFSTLNFGGIKVK